jgi:hypothetical protein
MDSGCIDMKMLLDSKSVTVTTLKFVLREMGVPIFSSQSTRPKLIALWHEEISKNKKASIYLSELPTPIKDCYGKLRNILICCDMMKRIILPLKVKYQSAVFRLPSALMEYFCSFLIITDIAKLVRALGNPYTFHGHCQEIHIVFQGYSYTFQIP